MINVNWDNKPIYRDQIKIFISCRRSLGGSDETLYSNKCRRTIFKAIQRLRRMKITADLEKYINQLKHENVLARCVITSRDKNTIFNVQEIIKMFRMPVLRKRAYIKSIRPSCFVMFTAHVRARLRRKLSNEYSVIPIHRLDKSAVGRFISSKRKREIVICDVRRFNALIDVCWLRILG